MSAPSLLTTPFLPETPAEDRAVDTRGFASIGLYAPKTADNVGGVMRAAKVFGSKMIVVANSRIRKERSDTMCTYRHIPVLQTDDLLSCRPWHSQLVVVECIPGARELHNFVHPTSAFYVFGPEDGSVPKHIVEKAQHVIRLRAWHCLNLAATVNVVLHDRVSKRGLG